MGKRILVILGHPSNDSFCCALAESYADAARKQGHELRELRLGQLNFDPILREGYRQVQPLEADLLAAQADISWADHLVFAYPIWWGGAPALLKGFIDRVFLPGYAFKYRPGKAFPAQLLAGRTTQLLVTMDTPPWYFRWIYHMPGIHQLRKTTLEFCGVKPVKVVSFGPILNSTQQQRERWLAQVRKLAIRV
ncbi:MULTISPECIES: NAD(P)H-dependent oxidoreductase [unclassified Janthinobacterium]|uniref:NAD(P)H-dependent oxidoreductase n=1 Tax=unclassified Janthinobacterium TaxID=2610881 RepID=UPI001610153B|nr:MULTISPECIES: NAD(P)H-dependent oxidoreductase [unclassified Janthinobacterium]MBB5607120.1 putative NADPH-quinone reductase [Janthinobacterium sp. S3T4]MBB5612845.1 putative NADPH-quinone reductase [Janthinobacterium sp. S3M3]